MHSHVPGMISQQPQRHTNMVAKDSTSQRSPVIPRSCSLDYWFSAPVPNSLPLSFTLFKPFNFPQYFAQHCCFNHSLPRLLCAYCLYGFDFCSAFSFLLLFAFDTAVCLKFDHSLPDFGPHIFYLSAWFSLINFTCIYILSQPPSMTVFLWQKQC